MTKLKKIERAEAFIRQELDRGPQLARNVIRESGLHPRTMERAARRMKVRRERVYESGPWVWRLPDELQPNYHHAFKEIMK